MKIHGNNLQKILEKNLKKFYKMEKFGVKTEILIIFRRNFRRFEKYGGYFCKNCEKILKKPKKIEKIYKNIL